MKKWQWLGLFTYIVCLQSSVSFAAHFQTKNAINAPNAPAPIGTYSEAIQDGDTVYISGQIALNPKTGKLISDNFNEQTKQVLKNLATLATAAGGKLDDIVKLTVYLTDLKNFDQLNEMMKRYFHPPYPSRVAVQISALPLHAQLEIEATMRLHQNI